MNLKNGKLLINGSEVGHSATNVALPERKSLGGYTEVNVIDTRSITIPNKVKGVDYTILARDFHQPQMFNDGELDMRWVPDPKIIWL